MINNFGFVNIRYLVSLENCQPELTHKRQRISKVIPPFGLSGASGSVNVRNVAITHVAAANNGGHVSEHVCEFISRAMGSYSKCSLKVFTPIKQEIM